jgi:predicted DNA-binding protein (MmcQ/YjbR family)
MSGKKGMVHKNRQFLLNRLQDMYGEHFDPVIQMSENAVKIQALVDSVLDDLEVTLKEKLEVLILAINAWEKPAQYTNAKRWCNFCSVISISMAAKS